jgi:hypothetical protein
MLKRYKSTGSNQIMAEMIQVGGNSLHFEIYKLIPFIWNQEETATTVKGIYYCTYLYKG